MSLRFSCIALAASASFAAAGTIAYNVPAATAGTQNFDGNLGMDFNVRAPAIRVTMLGAFDSNSDGINGTITAGVFNRATTGQVGTSATFTGSGQTLVAGSRFAAPSGGSFVLPRGFQGSIVAQGYNASELNGNVGTPAIPPWTTNSGAGNQIAFVGGSRWGNGAFGLPGNVDGGPVNRYAAGTFEFDLEPVTGVKTALWADPGSAGNQGFGGPLGMDFVVTSSIVISELGVFDDLGNGIAGSLTSELWRGDGSAMLASAAFDSGSMGTLDDGAQRFKSISPLVLTPGNYTIVGRGFSAADQNFNTGGTLLPAYIDDGGGAISFVGGSRFGNPGDPFPNAVDGGPANRYYAGTFKFDIIPEPVTATFAGLFAALLMLRRRR